MKYEWKVEERIYINIPIEETYWKDQVSIGLYDEMERQKKILSLRLPTQQRKKKDKYNVLWKHQKKDSWWECKMPQL